jgi:hypothetical protein
MAYVYLGMAVSDDPITPTEHVLDGRRYLFERTWVDRAETWFLDIRDAEGTILLQGIAIRVGQNLLAPHVGDDLPGEGRGALVALDTAGTGTDPGRDDLGTRVKLIYGPVAQLEEDGLL